MIYNLQTKPLDSLVGPAIIFKPGVRYIGAGMHCITLQYAGLGRNQLNLAYGDVTAVFVDGDLKWQNHDYSAINPTRSGNIELVLAPETKFSSKRKRTLRFRRQGDKTQKDLLKIIADEVESVSYNGTLLWPNQP